MKHFFYNSTLCYLGRTLCSAVRKFFYTNKRSGVAGHEEKKENFQGCIKYEPTASSNILYNKCKEMSSDIRFKEYLEFDLTKSYIDFISGNNVKPYNGEYPIGEYCVYSKFNYREVPELEVTLRGKVMMQGSI